MRYGAPSVDGALAQLKAQGCDRVLVVPALSAVRRQLDRKYVRRGVCRGRPHAQRAGAAAWSSTSTTTPATFEALARSVREYWTANGRPERLVMSFHGVPRFTLERGDPYHCECQKTGRLLAEALSLQPEQYLVAFQSRFGRAEWLKPYTQDTVEALGRQKTRRIDVICPGFVADCLETLEEIAIENKAAFLSAGGGEFHYIPCLNEREAWIEALARHLADAPAGLAGVAATVGREPDAAARAGAPSASAQHTDLAGPRTEIGQTTGPE